MLAAAPIIVVLAEPGAGKTELLNSLASRVGVRRIKAGTFRHQTIQADIAHLILDALDEVAKIDPSGIDAILIKARETGAKQLILASRSSEWEAARDRKIIECFGFKPFVAYLSAFDEHEQERLFENYLPKEKFDAFKAEISRFELDTLLSNPQFLQLFADAYLESGRRFKDKKEIFESAVKRLAYEANEEITQKNAASTSDQRVAWASELFAKLLLAGAEGVSVRDTLADRDFPRVLSLLHDDKCAFSVLDTRLFKPTDDPNKHEPVHRIVVEYCAANYLARRIGDHSDYLTLRQCMAIIAPNSTVREELRGLLGWMASVGDHTLQAEAIKLDPYAVLANGDPSQLLASSKKELFAALGSLASDDPYFRGGDFRRTFSVAGLFTPEVVEFVKPLLVGKNQSEQLRGLVLELLDGSPAAEQLSLELRALMLDPLESRNIRYLAHRCLVSFRKTDHLSDVRALISEGGNDALSVAAHLFEEFGVSALGKNTLLSMLRTCADLYPRNDYLRERVIESRYFVKRLIKTLEVPVVEWALEQLTADLTCKCGEQKKRRCHCLNGVSKISGHLLDRFFEVSSPPYDAASICQWLRNLNFHSAMSADRSAAVKALQTDHELRRSIQRLMLEDQSDPNVISEIRWSLFDGNSHSGLVFQTDDWRLLANLAFENDNSGLWSCFLKAHNCYRESVGPDEQRRHMRDQANAKPEFQRHWAKHNRGAKGRRREQRLPRYWFERRRRRHERKVAELNASHFSQNRELIERGEHWGWLRLFAERYLTDPEMQSELVNDPSLPERALCNCLPFIAPHIPSLARLAELQCASQGLFVETILYAACLAIFRKEGNLSSVSLSALEALKTNLDMGYRAVSQDEKETLEQEVDRLLFPSVNEVEAFARAYIEPQLRDTSCMHPEVGWLRYKCAFAEVQGKLALEWLQEFVVLRPYSLDTLFDICAAHSNRSELEELIRVRCLEILFFWPDQTEYDELEARRNFWFLRHFYFVEGGPDVIWHQLSLEKNSIFALNERSSRMRRADHVGWPELTASKVHMVMDAFVDQWPKVDLPGSLGSDSPKEETAYRFLTEVIWSIERDDPAKSLPILDKMLIDNRFSDFQAPLQSMRAAARRKKALRDFEAPNPSEIASFLDQGSVVTVEGLRVLALAQLVELQQAIKGGEFDTVELFYHDRKRVNENTASKRIAEQLKLRLNALNMAVTIEHHLKGANRCDITLLKMLKGNRKLLVIEVKGQWHLELFTAASRQLHERYSIHPDAEQQGIYLVLWFGDAEKVAGRKNKSIASAEDLRHKISASISPELQGFVDVFVLDVSRN